MIQGNRPYLKQAEFLTSGILHNPLANIKLACNASQVETVRLASEYVSTKAVHQIMAMFSGLSKVFFSVNSWEFHPSEADEASEEDSFDRLFATIAQIKKFEIEEYCSIPYTMWLSFKSLSKSFSIGKVYWYIDPTPLDEENNCELRISGCTMPDRVVGDNDKPSRDVNLNMDAHDHNSDNYFTLLESLALNTRLYNLTIITDGDARYGKLVSFGIYLDYLTKHCPTLLRLEVHNMIINTLPDYDSKNKRQRL